jgi:GGDEF domain-containing protein
MAQAERVAEKIRLALAADYSLKVSKPGTPEVWINHRCTASIGVALFVQKDPDDIDRRIVAGLVVLNRTQCK